MRVTLRLNVQVLLLPKFIFSSVYVNEIQCFAKILLENFQLESFRMMKSNQNRMIFYLIDINYFSQ